MQELLLAWGRGALLLAALAAPIVLVAAIGVFVWVFMPARVFQNYLSWWTIELSRLYILRPIQFLLRLAQGFFQRLFPGPWW
ncbi:MAG: hypothetical protein HY814_10995 [Candidatus Riflebacteria bacterium]|nr:hypothetical protein [Candidatus Riflebacteria bacterium]